MKLAVSKRLIRSFSFFSGASLLVIGAAGSLSAITLWQSQLASSQMSSAQGQLSSLHDGYVASTMAPNGDMNPYGVAVVPLTMGNLVKGDVLVSNFNSSSAQGGGTTILQINPTTGASSVFYQGASNVVGPVAIAINPNNDIVWVGDYGPAVSGGNYTGANGNITVISPAGTRLAVYNDTTTANTPGAPAWWGVWGQAFGEVNGVGAFYWTSAGNANGSGGGVWRVNPGAGGTSSTQPLHSTYALLATASSIPGSGNNANTAAGPQGLVFDNANDTLYVADDSNNTIYAIPNANSITAPVTPSVVYSGSALDAPQSLALNPTNGDLLVVNGAGNNNLVEIDPITGSVVATRSLTYNEPAGSLFGMTATTNAAGQLVIYYVDDTTNSLHALTPESGYAMAAADGGYFTEGGANFYGSMGGQHLNAPVVG
ncbi:hypothetical protein SAMN02745225_00583, partial [Ferrithrix thermotolerans DSM 19514]